MKIPRAYIVSENSVVHVTWRCHNRQLLLKNRAIKDKIIDLIFEKPLKYEIRIFDFIIMDNHVHLILQTKSAKHLGNYMRCVNSKIAQFVNLSLKRDSQVIRDRYKSPVVENKEYFVKLIAYVCLNRHRIKTKSDPRKDPYCSAFHRISKTPLSKHLANYSDFGLCAPDKDSEFLRQILDDQILLRDEKSKTFSNRYVVGSQLMITQVAFEIKKRIENDRRDTSNKRDHSSLLNSC